MGFVQSYHDGILGPLRGSSGPSWPATAYLALLVTNPTDDSGTGLVEVTPGTGTAQWNGYVRQGIASSTSNWSAPAWDNSISPPARYISNINGITFPVASITSGTITVVGIAFYDASTAGNLKYWAPLAQPKVVNNTDSDFFNSGDIKIYG